ncbi:hypothetical protein GL218_02749 [Daldinia childiae]|uniref:uncharacterized protein n=1 Tax=Daldinia childiae TaxID=326645 RepID=UPI0014472B54|nr:uncharacterized protein GL218_02749 [Daldinia childiae]KAF3065317.1 hypothetical protein GL218_02749 [Daldinia childiae]
MCHGHPHYHPCSHTSVKWLYCPEAMFDLDTGYETPCSNPIYSTPQPTNVDCPLQNCNFKALMGSWICCVCGKGPNTQGWCTSLGRRTDWNPLTRKVEEMEMPCGHGCCSSCSPSCEATSRGVSPEISFAEVRKGKSSRKAHHTARGSVHKRGTAYDFSHNNVSRPVMSDESEPVTSSTTSTNSRGSRRLSHDTSAEYSKKPKLTNGKKKSHNKGRIHH